MIQFIHKEAHRNSANKCKLLQTLVRQWRPSIIMAFLY